MTTRTTAPLARRLAASTVTAVLAFALAGCSHDNPQQDRALTASPESGGPSPRQQPGPSGAPLAELQGLKGLSLVITSAERDPAGYLTVRGDLKNHASTTNVVPAALRGNEPEVARTGASLAGATIADFTGGKRYYVLRDTSGRPLTTTGLST
ncbi:hypothetical protein ACWD0J_10170 [Streptomyces sp. NPDC003011]